MEIWHRDRGETIDDMKGNCLQRKLNTRSVLFYFILFFEPLLNLTVFSTTAHFTFTLITISLMLFKVSKVILVLDLFI